MVFMDISIAVPKIRTIEYLKILLVFHIFLKQSIPV